MGNGGGGALGLAELLSDIRNFTPVGHPAAFTCCFAHRMSRDVLIECQGTSNVEKWGGIEGRGTLRHC